MARKLDRTRPYGEIHGMAAAAFEQDGKFFNRAGDEIGAQEIQRLSGETGEAPPPPPPPAAVAPTAVTPASPPPAPSPVSAPQPAPEAVPSPQPIVPQPPAPSPLAAETDEELRVRLASLGQTFTTRDEALEFLKDKV